MDWNVERARMSHGDYVCSVDGMNGVYTGCIGKWDYMKQYIPVYHCVGKSYVEIQKKVECKLGEL